MKRFLTFFSAVILLASSLSAGAQEMNSLMFRRGVTSPELSEGNITFRFIAPKARKVEVSPSWLGYTKTLPMAQGEDGVWSVTVPQPDPELYTYTFMVDGVSMLDPANIFVQRDGSRYMNAVLIPGGYADDYAECSKPGNVEHVWYYSAENGMTRRMYVYTPYGYDRTDKKTKYPVLYLLHGGGGDEDAWATLGRTCQILDNLIAKGKAKPMFVVMPNGNPNQYAAQTLGIPVKQDVRQYASGFDNYSSLVSDILPYIEKNYPVLKDRKGRAVAGLSMGGGQSFYIAFRNVDTFANVGIFSSGLIGSSAIGGAPFNAEEHFPGMYSTPAKYNRFDVIYLSCGEEDNRIDGMKDFCGKLGSSGYKGVVWQQYPGGHEWKVWRRNLSDFVQLIFKK
ncbi:MAG: esterase [Bacteroidales bacterium]|nr:esterase [Bacteroidales bacterium]